MDNNNGALSFDVLIRDSNINAMLSKDEQRIADFTENVESNSQDIVGSFQNIGKAVGGIAMGAMLKSWVSDIISVRGEFQQLEIAFGTMLGSAEQATSLMKQLTNTAATTPFDLKGVAQSAKQLLAYGESAENVNDTLIRLGNIASGLSIPLNDLTYLYGTTMVQGRLFTQDVRQFMGRGIPLVQELGKALGKTTDEINQMVTDGKVGFKEVQMVIENLTNQGGMFYGLMEQQSKSLTGQISNLGDSWDMMLNEIGQNTEGILSGGISTLNKLVENYDTCLRVLGALVATYGTYKVALAATAIAQGKSTGMASIDNIVLKAKAGLFTSLSANAQAYIKQNELMTASQQAYTLELQKCLTTEQQEQILRTLKIQAIQQLLTAEQQQYVSRLNLTAGSAEYVAAMEAVLATDQKAELSKKQLSADSMAYSVAVQETVAATQNEVAAQLAAAKAEGAALKEKQIALTEEYRVSLNKIEATRVQIALAKQQGNTTAVAALKQQQYNQLKQHAVIVTNMKNAATAKEAVTEKAATLAKQQASIAGTEAAASDAMQATSKTMLSTATTFLIGKLRVLWATMMANPITAIISLLGMAVSAIMLFGKKTEEANDIQGEFQESMHETYGTLNTYFAVLKRTEQGTTSYKKALDGINNLCREHNIELLKENASLEELVKKHDELIDATERLTASKLKAKYAEEAMQKVTTAQTDALDKLKDAAEDAMHKEMGWGQQYNQLTGDMDTIYGYVDTTSEHIRSASSALWEAVIGMANEGAEKLAGKTGKAYEDGMKELVGNITKAVQDATGATKEEMESFEPSIKAAVESVSNSIKEGKATIALVDEQVKSLFATWNSFDASETKQQVDLASKSFEELDKMAEEAEKAIKQADGQEINVSVGEQTFTQLSALKDYLDEINNAIGQKTTNLNTENGINARIKELKALRAEATIGSEEWKNYDKQITQLEGKLPATHKAAASAANKAAHDAERAADAQKQAGQKAVEVALEVEKKKVDAIKDGYKQRVAELELEHKQELARIDKEQQELEKMYKKGGKGMPASVSKNFDELRSLENSNYEQEKTELLVQEMDIRKKEYERYYSWVRQYGEDVASSQFAELMEQGNSYEQWLENKIAALKEQANGQEGGFTLEQGNQFVAMREELNSIRGLQTATEQFNESLQKARDNSKTLGDYIGELARKKQELQQGRGGLIGEERTKAIIEIDKQITEQTEELQRQLLEKYRSSAAMREDVEREYQQEITWLQQHGYMEQAALAEQARKRAVGELQAQTIQSTDMWEELFRDAEYLSGKAFENVVEQLKAMIEEIEDSNIKDALLGQLDDLRRQTQGTNNPFKQLVSSIKEYNKAVDGSADKKKHLTQMFTDIGGCIDQVKQSFDSIVDGLKEMGIAGDEETQALLGDISSMMGGAGQLAKGIATMNPADMISGGVSVITSAISLFDSSSRRIKREMKEHAKQLSALQRMYSEIQWNVENSVGEDYYKDQQRAIENLKAQKVEYEELARLEQSKKSKDRDDDKVQEYLQSAKDAELQIKDIEKEITESLVQTSFKDLANELADTWADAFGSMKDSTEDFDKIFAQTISNAVKNSLKLKLIEPVVSDFTKAMADYMGIHNNSIAGFDFAHWKTLLQSAGTQFTEGLEGFKEFFEEIGDATEDAKDTLEGQVASVTEETASQLAGEITTMRIRQYDMLAMQENIEAATISAGESVRNCISYLQTIAQNTSYNSKLVDITRQLDEIKVAIATDPLRAKGYN